MEMCCVFFEVGSEFLNTVQTRLKFKRLIRLNTSKELHSECSPPPEGFHPRFCPSGALSHWALPSEGWRPLGFYHLRLDHPGLGNTKTAPGSLASSGDCAPWGYPNITPHSKYQLGLQTLGL
jgi:hypothetical protein